MLRMQRRESSTRRMHAVLQGRGSGPGVPDPGGVVSGLYEGVRVQCWMKMGLFVRI